MPADAPCHCEAAEYSRLQLRWSLIETLARLLLLGSLPLVTFYVLVPLMGGFAARFAPRNVRVGVVVAIVWTLAFMLIGRACEYHREHRLAERFGLSREPDAAAARRIFARCWDGLAILAGMATLALSLAWKSTAHVYTLWAFGLGIVILLPVWALFRRRRRWGLGGLDSDPADADPRARDVRAFAHQLVRRPPRIRILRASGRGIGACGAYSVPGWRQTIYLTDTLLDEMTPRELRCVVAHEVGHRARPSGVPGAERLRGFLAMLYIFLVMAGYFAAFVWMMSVARLGRQALIALSTVPFLIYAGCVTARPGAEAMSRCNERQANRFALRATDDPEAFISAMRKLAARNLIIGRPGWWEKLLLITHPSLEETIDQARRYQRENKTPAAAVENPGGKPVATAVATDANESSGA